MDRQCPAQGPEANKWAAEKIMGWDWPTQRWAILAFDPCNNLNDTAMMEKKIEEMGKWPEYVAVLLDSQPDDDESRVGDWRARGLSFGLRVSPYERVQAAWKVINQ